MTTLFETAMYWKRAGVATIPIQYRDKRPDARLLPKDENGDATWEPFKQRLPTEDELKQWFPSSLHNLAVITGWNNLVVLDFDDLGAYLKWSIWATRTGDFTCRAMELTYMVQTARGVHVYFRTAQPEQNRKLQGIDIKARWGYVLHPPSVHPSGAEYKVLQAGVPVSIEALSDVLPASFLIQQNQVQTVSGSPVKGSSQIFNNDPWSVIMHAPDPDRDLIDQIRASYRIEQFFTDLEDTGGSGRWKMALCPFHEDKHPSFWLDTTRQICACYGGCTSKPLDVINLYARLNGLTNRDAIFYMAKQL